MTYWRIRSWRSSSIMLLGAAMFFLTHVALIAQDWKEKSSSKEHPYGASSSASNQQDERVPTTDELAVDTLPDAPMPEGQAQNQSTPPVSPSGRHLNQFPVLPPRLTNTPLTAQDKFRIYVHGAFGPPAVILPTFGAGLGMLNPPSKYPKEWKDGADGFGRLYGARVATITSRRTAAFITQLALHEDPRYLRSTSTNPFGRTAHALAFTLFDKTDSGRSTVAVSTFAAAAAGGFVGMGFYPDGYNDATHAEQRAAAEFGTIALGHVIAEFEPEWGPWAKKIHLPKLLPAWWVPEH
jgi:hypothetical protein